jgi:segregation and condensation protein B
MESNDIRKILEALLFITEQPISLKTLETLFDPPVPRDELLALLKSLSEDYDARGSALEVREIAGGWQFSTRTEFAPWVRKLFKDRLTYRLSSSAMETLSIVAYKQPITRSEIEEIRGVEVTAVLDTLVERKLIRIAGRKETVGRPLLYATTPDFLRAFGLKRLEDLPSIESLIPPATPVVSEEAAPEAVAAESQN